MYFKAIHDSKGRFIALALLCIAIGLIVLANIKEYKSSLFCSPESGNDFISLPFLFMKICPYCDEQIESNATKCLYCWENIILQKKNRDKIDPNKWKIWKKDYTHYVLIGFFWIVTQTIWELLFIEMQEIYLVLVIISAIFFAYLFYWTILRFHDINKSWKNAFYVLIPLIWLFVIIDLLSKESVNPKKSEIVVKDLKEDTIKIMRIYAFVILIIIFISYNITII